uniref:Vacuolar protein 14 C-terminal Fig4-binding domain-containing protein n=1 Tax=Hanusia phi TaxID=3032 RepID=A0A7S0EZA4_9CRYP|mmetsp:Transcript_34307/g.77272  ORF Transcript_34307/g.77272 Transcript_34307/m.77272 type:complete len:690 (+) Transcript_34307:133-2202(+)
MLNHPLQENLIPAATLRNLSDRVYEKRKAAALEIENLVKERMESPLGGRQDIENILTILGNDYALSSQANLRKGGLIGMAAAALGLGGNAWRWLNLLLPPILNCFMDQDSRVRYYACEALYNVAKVTKTRILNHFNQVFQGLCQLCADTDQGVKNGSQLLDQLLKDIIAESTTWNISEFIPVLKEHLEHTGSYVRHFLLGWIATLQSIPHFEIHKYLAEILYGVIIMLDDDNREIRQQADSVLSHLLRTLQSSEDINYNQIMPVLVRCATLSPPKESGLRANESNTSLELYSRNEDLVNRVALMWIVQLMEKGKKRILPFTGELVRMLLTAEESSVKVRELSREIDDSLRQLLEEEQKRIESPKATSGPTVEVGGGFDIVEVASAVIAYLEAPLVGSRLKALNWFDLLVDMMETCRADLRTNLLAALIHALHDQESEVVSKSLRILRKLSNKGWGDVLPMIVSSMIQFLQSDAAILQERSGKMLRELAVILDSESVYLEFANSLKGKENDMGSKTMVEKLTIILLSVPELSSLRNKLIGRKSKGPSLSIEDAASPTLVAKEAEQGEVDLFASLLPTWMHVPACALALSLLAGKYEQSYELVVDMGDRMRDLPGEETISILIQLDQLVQLIESPVFAPMRMELLEPAKHPYLIKTMFGILMLLPQSEAFDILRKRLKSVPALAMLALQRQ